MYKVKGKRTQAMLTLMKIDSMETCNIITKIMKFRVPLTLGRYKIFITSHRGEISFWINGNSAEIHARLLVLNIPFKNGICLCFFNTQSLLFFSLFRLKTFITANYLQHSLCVNESVKLDREKCLRHTKRDEEEN